MRTPHSVWESTCVATAPEWGSGWSVKRMILLAAAGSQLTWPLSACLILALAAALCALRCRHDSACSHQHQASISILNVAADTWALPFAYWARGHTEKHSQLSLRVRRSHGCHPRGLLQAHWPFQATHPPGLAQAPCEYIQYARSVTLCE